MPEVTIFVPVQIEMLNVSSCTKNHFNPVFDVSHLKPNDITGKLDAYTFASRFDYKKLARTLTCLTQGRRLAVGESFEEAEAIANQPSYQRHHMILVKLNISDRSISKMKFTEAQIRGDFALVADECSATHVLIENVSFHERDIVSVAPMVSYSAERLNQQSLKTSPHSFWPEEDNDWVDVGNLCHQESFITVVNLTHAVSFLSAQDDEVMESGNAIASEVPPLIEETVPCKPVPQQQRIKPEVERLDESLQHSLFSISQNVLATLSFFVNGPGLEEVPSVTNPESNQDSCVIN